MKKRMALLLAIIFVIALFAGCSKPASDGNTTSNNNNTTNNTTNNSTPAPSSTAGSETTPPVEEDSPYKLPNGKYEVDADGFPTAAYDYELPLSTTDEIFTYWTVCWTPAYIPESGYGSMPYPQYLNEQTGVNIEYVLVTSEQRQSNFSVLLAADDLCDISAGAVSFYTGTIRSSVEDGWLANLYDYREYMPNYMYQCASRDNVDVWSKVFYDTDIITAFYSMTDTPLPSMGMAIRRDWCDKWGIDYKAIDTYDELYDAMMIFKSHGVKSPTTLYSRIEQMSGYEFCGYNTTASVNPYGLPYARKTLDGKIQFTQTTEDDRDCMAMIQKWYLDDLIDKDWASYSDSTGAMHTAAVSDEVGIFPINPAGVPQMEVEDSDPDCEWVPLPRLKKTEDQKIMFGQNLSHFNFGSSSISAKCENIPLMVSYIDWFYSDAGYFAGSFGVQGLTWDYNEDGEIRLTDFTLQNPDGLGSAWILVFYANNALAEGGMKSSHSRYCYDGGERIEAFHLTYIVDGYKGEMDVPSSMTFTEDEENELDQYSNDICTYIGENYLAFVDGSKPMSEWDSYVEGLYGLGLAKCEEIYQQAYDRFMARFE